MNYSIMIYETAEDFAKRSDPARRDAHFGGWMKYFDELRAAGTRRPAAFALQLMLELA